MCISCNYVANIFNYYHYYYMVCNAGYTFTRVMTCKCGVVIQSDHPCNARLYDSIFLRLFKGDKAEHVGSNLTWQTVPYYCCSKSKRTNSEFQMSTDLWCSAQRAHFRFAHLLRNSCCWTAVVGNMEIWNQNKTYIIGFVRHVSKKLLEMNFQKLFLVNPEL